MHLQDFEYYRPDTVAEAIRLLSEQADAKILAAGQSLIPILNMGLGKPAALIDIARIGELRFVRDAGERVLIGALATHHEIATSALIQSRAPIVAAAAGHIGHSQVRRRGTVGGSLAHADPAAELPVAALITEAVLVAASQRGERHIPAADFFLGPLLTSLAADEILVRIEIPSAPPPAGVAFREFTRRRGDFGLVIVAAQVLAMPGGASLEVRLAVGGVNPVAVRLTPVEEAARGRAAAPGLWSELAAQGAALLEPESDHYASAEFRREIAAVLIREALAEAALKAGVISDG